MESKGKRKSEGESEEKRNFQPHQYTRNLQRIFQQESNFKFRTLGSYDEDKELLSPAESEPDDIAGDEQIDEPEAVHSRVVSEDPGGGPGGGLDLPGRRKSEDFIIIDSDLKEQSVTPKRVARKHFLSSPYKVLNSIKFNFKTISPRTQSHSPAALIAKISVPTPGSMWTKASLTLVSATRCPGNAASSSSVFLSATLATYQGPSGELIKSRGLNAKILFLFPTHYNSDNLPSCSTRLYN